MASPTDTLGDLLSLFCLPVCQTLPLATGERLAVTTMEVTETAALAITLNLYCRQAGNRAARSRTRTNPCLCLIPKEDRYDRTL